MTDNKSVATSTKTPPPPPPPEATPSAPPVKGRRIWYRAVALIAFLAVLGAAALWPWTLQLPKSLQAVAEKSTATGAGDSKAMTAAATEEKAKAPALAPAITVVTAEVSQVSETIMVSGTLVPREEVLVSPEVEGLSVREVLVDEGDMVKKGDVLARLNRSTLELQMSQNKAQIARAGAAIAQARTGVTQADATKIERSRSLDRTKSLRNQGFASDAKLDQDMSASRVSDAQVLSSKQAVEVAIADQAALQASREDIEWRLARTEVRAPVGGVISRKSARIGQIGSGQGEAMFRIIGDGDVELEADVGDTAITRLSKNMPVSVLLAGGAKKVDGTVRLIRPEIDAVTRLGKVRVKLPNTEGLIIGSSARGLIEIGNRSGVSVPLSAVTFDKDGATLQVVTGDVVKTRRVTIGLTGGERAEVTEGLKVGELVVTRAGTFLRDGDKVRPMPQAKVAQKDATQ
jgi:HlyD family secretion protein